MEEFEIRRTDQDPLVFHGALLAKVKSPSYETEEGQRAYELSLYEHADDGFVVSIEYWTTCPQERCVVQAEIVDEPQDVEKVLLVFEPCEHVDRQTLRSLSDERRQKLRKILYRSYDDQVSEILGALTRHRGHWRDLAESQGQAGPSTPRRGLLSFLKMR